MRLNHILVLGSLLVAPVAAGAQSLPGGQQEPHAVQRQFQWDRAGPTHEGPRSEADAWKRMKMQRDHGDEEKGWLSFKQSGL